MSEDDEEQGSFSIRIVDGDGDPIPDRQVTVLYPAMSGGEDQYTNEDGWCEFPSYGHSYTRKIYSYRFYGIWARKEEVLLSDGEDVSDGATFSFTVIDGE